METTTILLLIVILLLIIILINVSKNSKNKKQIKIDNSGHIIKETTLAGKKSEEFIKENDLNHLLNSKYPKYSKIITKNTSTKTTYINGEKTSEETEHNFKDIYSESLTNCPNCGAKIEEQNTENCPYCNTLLTSQRKTIIEKKIV